jgi:hypothetical protein
MMPRPMSSTMITADQALCLGLRSVDTIDLWEVESTAGLVGKFSRGVREERDGGGGDRYRHLSLPRSPDT